MGFTHRSNNRILPANSRAVNVARQTIRDLTPVQQRSYHNAFMVQGYEAVVYSRLWQGQPCSCQSRRQTAASILGEDGKLPPGTIDQIMSGGLEFQVNRYGASSLPSSDRNGSNSGIKGLSRDDQFFGDLTSENQTPFPISGNARHLDDPYIDSTEPDGVNGPNQDLEFDDIAPDFDGEVLDLTGSRCTCCYGTGFIGGYSILGGTRKVIAPNSPEAISIEGSVELNVFPNAWRATRIEIHVVLPVGYTGLDAFRVWNNIDRVVTGSVTIDSLPFSSQLLAAKCDGRPHIIVLEFDAATYVTHLEVQIVQTRESALIEFPKINKGSNIALQDLTGDVDLSASPLIPHLAVQDVIVESTFGKPFLIKSADLWNDKDRNVHGWDCQARVIQPNELLAFLPRRRQMQQRSTVPVRDNMNGIRRT